MGRGNFRGLITRTGILLKKPHVAKELELIGTMTGGYWKSVYCGDNINSLCVEFCFAQENDRHFVGMDSKKRFAEMLESLFCRAQKRSGRK